MAKTKKPESPEIAREEWDFSWVPDHLVWDCWAYEFSREAMRGGTKMPQVVFDILAEYPPSKIWPFKRRAGVKRLMKGLSNAQQKEGGRDRWLESRLKKHGYDLSVSLGPVAGRANLLIAIDWERESSALVKDFEELLGRHRKVRKRKTRRGGRPAQLKQRRAELKFLGALRLSNAGYTFDEGSNMTQNVCGESLYEEPARWSVAKKNAQKLISNWPTPFVGDIFYPDQPQLFFRAKHDRKSGRKAK